MSTHDDHDDSDDLEPSRNPEACPECGCLPGEGYTHGCKACERTIELFYDAACPCMDDIYRNERTDR